MRRPSSTRSRPRWASPERLLSPVRSPALRASFWRSVSVTTLSSPPTMRSSRSATRRSLAETASCTSTIGPLRPQIPSSRPSTGRGERGGAAARVIRESNARVGLLYVHLTWATKTGAACPTDTRPPVPPPAGFPPSHTSATEILGPRQPARVHSDRLRNHGVELSRPQRPCDPPQTAATLMGSLRTVHLPPVPVHPIHDREYACRRPPAQQDPGEARDSRQHPPPRPEDDVAESDGRVAHEREVQRCLQVRQHPRGPEHDGPEADLDQMEQDDRQEEPEEERHATGRARGLEDQADTREPVNERQHPDALDDHAGNQQREAKQGETHEIASSATGAAEKFKRAAAAPDAATHRRCPSGR